MTRENHKHRNTYGGFFGFEDDASLNIHSNALRINAARFSLDLVKAEYNPQRIHVPVYCCHSIKHSLSRLRIEMVEYELLEDFSIKDVDKIPRDEWVLLLNYWGLFEHKIQFYSKRFPKVIIDNSQAFFAPLTKDQIAFNSARKFFGVPNGAFVSGISIDFELKAQSNQNINHLERKDSNPDAAFKSFRLAEKEIAQSEISRMSRLTEIILSQKNFKKIQQIRQSNFDELDNCLKTLNLFSFNRNDQTPLCYPFMVKNAHRIRRRLIEDGVFTPLYWPEVEAQSHRNSFEFKLSHQIINLPIDQRYSLSDMHIITDRLIKILD